MSRSLGYRISNTRSSSPRIGKLALAASIASFVIGLWAITPVFKGWRR